MTEDLIHFVWKHNPILLKGIVLPNLGELEVLSIGEHNLDSGPDFFNAKIRIGNTIWAGNVEIHINASDWNKHGHNSNSAYNSVVLHVVTKNDIPVYNSKGEQVLTVEIPYPDHLEWELQRLVANESWIPCANHLSSFDQFSMRMWLAKLAVERLENKTTQVYSLLTEYNGSWEEAFYVSIARSFGLKINALPFEMLAKTTPLKILSKVKDNITTLEALLFGQAGMLSSDLTLADKYTLLLNKEYDYQQKKHSLSSIENHLWKFMRLRPSAFPSLRIAQFAMLLHKSNSLFSQCIEAKDITDIYQLLKVDCSEYWNNHYVFGKESDSKIKSLGSDAISTIILNSIVPFMFAYGSSRANETLKDKALSILESMKPEKNKVVDCFGKSGVTADSAFFSQAMVQLKTQYCDKRKCLYCHIGAKVLLKRAQ
jgi:hypothetical protein